MMKLKKVFFTLPLILLSMNSQSLFSQNTKSVVIEYQEKRAVNEEKIKNLPERIQQVVRAKSKWRKSVLIHNEEGSYYMLQDKIEDKTVTVSDTQKRTVKVGQKVFFNDFLTNNSYQELRMYNENVLIKDKLNKYKWELLSETKKINDIVCKKATTTNEHGRTVVAWYTDKFGITNGPQGYYGLPGLIVYLDDGKYTFKMDKVSFSDKKLDLLKPSKNANVVTPEEYMNNYVNGKSSKSQRGNTTTTRRRVQN
ncbi:GLPGLI family protein [Kordia sp. YSTF-M3]|uniref:GLPGLI family protein n=1 Tax=Kordia aestuariivivens TaxID=2759037 RepID=A0ABR7Q869_9FLAO|nr:GLPGLI family protein [Kordia aestuariivivens]MBC8754766.1 GLPGLI family protein [Kordia aestuariivivens]